MFDSRENPPETLYLSIPASDICNFRCRHCHIWLQEVRANPLPRARRLDLVAEFAHLNPQGTVVVPGGEVTLNLEELYAVASACKKFGLGCVVVSNGSRIRNAQEARRLAESGVTLCAVSLDSHLPEIHNFIRGLPSAFDDAIRAIRLLAEASAATGGRFRAIVATVVCKRNLSLLRDLVDFVRGLGAANLDLQILAKTFANANPARDPFFAENFWHTYEEKEEAKRAFRAFLAGSATDGGFVVKKSSDLPWIESYIDDPDFQTAIPVCGSHYSNLIVNVEGDAALCFNTKSILDQPYVGNAGQQSLAELWSGTKAAHDRDVMEVCRLNCGALNCHRRRSQAASA